MQRSLPHLPANARGVVEAMIKPESLAILLREGKSIGTIILDRDDHPGWHGFPGVSLQRLHTAAMIDEAAAIEIARARAAKNGWAFSEPLSILRRRGWRGKSKRFEIETNAASRGTKARFVVDAETGEILSEGYLPR